MLGQLSFKGFPRLCLEWRVIFSELSARLFYDYGLKPSRDFLVTTPTKNFLGGEQLIAQGDPAIEDS